jgi:RNA polymerase sigma factor (sigma-70 family)
MKFEGMLAIAIVLLSGPTPIKGCGYSVSLATSHHNFSMEAVWDVSCKDRSEATMKGSAHEDRFEAILLEYDGPLRRLVSAYEKDAFLRNDLLQEIRLALWRALPSFREQSSERTFIYRIAHNRALTHIAKRYPGQLNMEMALDLPDVSPDPEEILVLRWQQAELRARIASLPLTLRQVVTLALEGLSNIDISQILGISEGNVAVRLTRAKKHLRTGDATNE